MSEMYEYSEEQMKKRHFVENELKQCLQAASHDDIESVNYVVDTCRREFVILRFSNDRCYSTDVSDDSLLQIVYDVLKGYRWH